MDEPGALTEPEERAWRGLMTVVALGLPQIERTFREHGLVHIEYLLLQSLAQTPDGLRLSDLAGCARSSQSRLSHRMRKLIDLGYVAQLPCGTDGRVTIAQITDEGRAMLDTLCPAHLRDVRRVLFDHLDESQLAALAGALEAVAVKLSH